MTARLTRHGGKLFAGVALALGCAAVSACGSAEPTEASPVPADPIPASPAGTPATVPEGAVGLYTSLPIVWAESEGVSGLLAEAGPPHWAMATLRGLGEPVIFDTLAGPAGLGRLGSDALLVLAQPRPLSPDENVALDDWVRGGGHVLLFADPMITAPSRFALGDPRRPQDVALLSPILARWGLELVYDERQPEGARSVAWRDTALTVNQAGSFAKRSEVCKLESEGLVAQCRVGSGGILAVADAALLDSDESQDTKTSARTLRSLLGTAQKR